MVESGFVSFSHVASWVVDMEQPSMVGSVWIWPQVKAAMSLRCRVGDNVEFEDSDGDSDAEDDAMKDDPIAEAKKDVEEGLVTILAKANEDMGEGDAYTVALRCGACDLLRAAYTWRLVGEEFGGDIEGIRAEFF